MTETEIEMDEAYKNAVDAIARVNGGRRAEVDAEDEQRPVHVVQEVEKGERRSTPRSDVFGMDMDARNGGGVAMMRRTEMQQLQLEEQRRMEEAVGRRAAVIGGHIGVGSSDAATISSGSLAAAGEDVWRRSQASVLAMPNETLAQQVKGVEVEATEVKDMTSIKHARAVPPPLRSPRFVSHCTQRL